jgi:hypothetical protein
MLAQTEKGRPCTRIAQLVFAALLALTTGGAGYFIGGQREAVFLAKDAIPSLDCFTTQNSFSEIENSKAGLEALSARFRMEVQARRLAGISSASSAGVSGSASEPRIGEAIADLEWGMNEFAGTEQELCLAQELLLALKRANRFDRWVQVYLQMLYQHPTHPAVTRFIDSAIQISQLAGHEEEMLEALRYLNLSPIEFQGKENVQAALLRADRKRRLAHNENTHLPAGQERTPLFRFPL